MTFPRSRSRRASYELRGHRSRKTPRSSRSGGTSLEALITGAGHHPRTGYKLDCLLEAGGSSGSGYSLAPLIVAGSDPSCKGEPGKNPEKTCTTPQNGGARSPDLQGILNKIAILLGISCRGLLSLPLSLYGGGEARSLPAGRCTSLAHAGSDCGKPVGFSIRSGGGSLHPPSPKARPPEQPRPRRVRR